MKNSFRFYGAMIKLNATSKIIYALCACMEWGVVVATANATAIVAAAC